MLKRFEDDGEPEDRPGRFSIMRQNALHRFYASLGGVFANFPNPLAARR